MLADEKAFAVLHIAASITANIKWVAVKKARRRTRHRDFWTQ